MKNFFSIIFCNSFLACKRHKGFLIFLIIMSVICIILGAFAGVKINHSMFPQDFSNVVYVKYLKGSLGFSGFLFSQIFTLLFFLAIIFTCSAFVLLIPIGILFFLYFVYAQTVTIISICMEFGFFNTLILLIFLVIISFCYFFLFCMVFLICLDCCGTPNYFRVCLRDVFPILIAFLIVVLITTITLMTLKKFVFILVYKN